MIVTGIPRSVADLNAPDFVRSAPPGWTADAPPPFAVTRVTLRPGEITAAHSHHDTEVWIMLAGRGEVRSDGRVAAVTAGDTVTLPPLERHTLRNLADDEPLTFLSVYWEDMPRLAAAHAPRRAASVARDERPVLLLPSFPTPNGELHLGHMAGPYLGADFARRALLAAGTPAHLLLGTVGHQSQVAAAANADGVSFHTLAERNTDSIMAGLRAAGIEWDVFVRPRDEVYPALARQVFERLRHTGVVVRRTVPTNFCPSCEVFLFEAFVAGACPHCGSRDTAGIECERCALPFADADLVDASCGTCGRAAEHRPLERWLMPLEPLRDRLTAYLASVRTGPRIAAYASRILAGPLPDLPVSVVAADGIELPDSSGQRMYSAFELAARFLTAVDRLARDSGADGWQSYLEEHRPRTALFFGFDNAYLRVVVFPAVLGAFTDRIDLPDTLIGNEFYLLNGAKFSTGRGHVIWGRDVFDDKTRDRLRLFLAATRPEHRRRNFSTVDHDAFVQRELVGRLDDWLAGVGKRVAGRFAGRAPTAGTFFPSAEEFAGRIATLHTEITAALALDRFSPAGAVAALLAFLKTARRFAEDAEDLLTAPALDAPARTCVALELMAVRSLTQVLRPLVPAAADRLAEQIGTVEATAEPRWVTPGTPVRVSPLFS